MNMQKKVPIEELNRRIEFLRHKLFNICDDYLIMINNKVNMYYLTGTMQDGVLCITPENATLFVRKSIERAKNESNFGDIRQMRSFREIAAAYGDNHKLLFVEKKTATLDWLSMVQKYITAEQVLSINNEINAIRSVKSQYEINLMLEVGKIHAHCFDEVIPTLFREGMSEAELCALIFMEFVKRGFMGIGRFNNPLAEDVGGYVSFGVSTLVKTAFDGPGGNRGTCIAAQAMGSYDVKLEQNSLIYIDNPFAIEGYHSDKTMVYYFGDIEKDKNADLIIRATDICIDIENKVADMLVPGAIPSEIYAKALEMVPQEFEHGFMGGVKFLGHSIGLTVDETPAIAKGFDEPIEEGMFFAIEPKIALDNIGTVGTENTYCVGRDKTFSISGLPRPIKRFGG